MSKPDKKKENKKANNAPKKKKTPKSTGEKQERPAGNRTGKYLLVSLILAVATAALFVWASFWPDTLFSFYTGLSRRMLGFLALCTAPIPFALWEWIVLGLVIWFFVSLVRDILKKRMGRWFSGLLMGVCIGVFAFTFLWGLNHFGPSIETRMDITVQEATVSQLRAATEYYMEKANELSAQVPRDEAGWFDPGPIGAQSDFSAESFETLAAENENFSGSTAPVKTLTSSWFFGKIGITGIFVAFTGESCVSSKSYVCSQPFTVSHEMAHRLCFAGEDEANFAAYLACEGSKSMIMQYSGYYQAFVYCYNALHESDRAQAMEVWNKMTPEFQMDCINANTHHAEVSSEAATKIAETVNDVYLKAFSEESGVQSYGEVTDLLVAWYLQKTG